MRLFWIGLGALLLSLGIAQAQEKPLTPLTAQEVADGWIMLCDGETTFGWKPRGAARWTPAENALNASEGAGVLSTTTEFGDFALHLECRSAGNCPCGLMLRGPVKDGAITRENAYEIPLDAADKKFPPGSLAGIARSRRRVNHSDGWLAVDVTAEGDHLRVAIDGQPTADARDARFARGVIGLRYGGKGTVSFRNIRLRPLSLKSAFNGKDMTGWRTNGYKGRIGAEIGVTPEGCLSLKHGFGDAQTEAQWGDLALQAEVYTVSDHANSGIFVRGTPGVLWAGYECQIRNQWEGDDRTKAVDFGTGGIAHRQPARRVVSSDREWFTVTEFAHGLHFAIWVNGYQTADWVDTRPMDQTNARNGARTKAGTISLQCHDRNTDAMFRNLRVVELPPGRE